MSTIVTESTFERNKKFSIKSVDKINQRDIYTLYSLGTSDNNKIHFKKRSTVKYEIQEYDKSTLAFKDVDTGWLYFFKESGYGSSWYLVRINKTTGKRDARLGRTWSTKSTKNK